MLIRFVYFLLALLAKNRQPMSISETNIAYGTLLVQNIDLPFLLVGIQK